MKKKKSKFYKIIILIVSTIALILIIITTIMFFNSNVRTEVKKPTLETKSVNQQTKNKNDDFFPRKINLDHKKIYSLIRIKQGKSFFKKELISLILNQVIKKGSFINGKLKYWYRFSNNNKNFDIAFRWESSSGKVQEKTYSIKIINE